MDTATHLGRNRTGIQMSPFSTVDMKRGLDEFAPPSNADRADLGVRLDYADATEGLGSVPLPGTLKGMVATGVDMLTGNRPQVLIDKLGERLAFERGGTRLYDGLLVKCRAAGDKLPREDLAALTQFREDELMHFNLVAEALRSLGADPTAQTPCADLVGVESMGLIQAMNDPRTSLVQSLHVMMDAELLDNAGWEMLIELATASGHPALADRFRAAAVNEAQHLVRLKELLRRFTMADASLVATAAGAMGSTAGPDASSAPPVAGPATGPGIR